MAKPFNVKWNSNEKLEKTSGGDFSVIGFGIPADVTFRDENGERRNTCPGALACRAVCFAKQGGYRFPMSIAARSHNLTFSQSDGFVAGIVSDLLRMRSVNTVRIHDSGDFYSQEYFDKWCDIAKTMPHLTFYAYTKSLHLDLTGAPANFKITQSLGGRYDASVDLARPHSRIFSTHDDRERAGYIDGNVSDAPAIQGLVQIGLVYHGVRHLTPAQKKFFA